MFEHLIDFDPTEDFKPGDKVSPGDMLDAKFRTTEFLDSLDPANSAKVADEAQRTVAQNAFATLTTNFDTSAQLKALAKADTPEAVKHLVGMLTAYDWQFVEQAQELRGYTVAGLVEETKHPDARIRLRALELLGRVTEVALFTDRVEIKHTQISDDELDAQLEAKLKKLRDAEIVITPELQLEDASAAPA